jgi:magnesium chelatase subunit H
LHAHLATEDYQRLFPYWQEIEPLWGPPPGHLLSDHAGLQVLGRQFGNLLVCVQPSFGYEDDPMRLLMATNASPHHGFAAFYTYLDKVWNADATLHFGTHGSMEFMPGKQIGLSAKCWPDRLIGELPNYYLYSVNNPSEGTIAKRRGFATLLSYLSPPMENAGLYRQLVQLKELINGYRRKLKEAGSESGVVTLEASELEAITDLAEALELKPKVDPAQDVQGYILNLYNDLLEIEERLIPTGLHILDVAPVGAELVDLLNAVANFARGKPGGSEEILSLTESVARGLGYNLENIRQEATNDENALACWEKVNRIQREAVTLFVEELNKSHLPNQAIKRAAHYLLEHARV